MYKSAEVQAKRSVEHCKHQMEPFLSVREAQMHPSPQGTVTCIIPSILN